jgi:diguanylate cyclase (GGDEF)-like protein/PAS domain S-box-containing protein
MGDGGMGDGGMGDGGMGDGGMGEGGMGEGGAGDEVADRRVDQQQGDDAPAAEPRLLAMLGALVQRSEDLSLVVRRDSTITYASDAIERMLGYHPSGVVGQRAADFVHPDDLEVFERALGLVLAGTLDRTPLLRVRHADGRWIRLEVTAANLLDVPEVAGIAVNVREVSERYEAEEQLRRSEARFRALVRNASEAILIVDRDGTITYASPAIEALCGRSPEELVGNSGLVLLDDADHGVATSRFGALVGGARPLRLEHHMAHRDGTTRWVESTLTNLLGDPDVGGVVVNSRDVTESRVALRALEESEQRFRSLAASSPIGIVRIEPTGRLTYVNDRFRQIVNRTDPDDQPRYAAEVVHPADRDAAVAAWRAAVAAGEAYDRQVRVDRRDDEVCWVHIRTVPLGDEAGHLTGHVGTVEDVTGRLELEARLAHQATHDPLTRLPNRTLLIDRLEVALARGARAGTTVALLFCDLDRFKAINDGLGHSVGDAVLCQVSDVLRGAVRPGDTVARFGGDEFVVLCEDLGGADDAVAIAHRIQASLEAPIPAAGSHVRVSSSIGLALSQPGERDVDDLIGRADTAMYRAKGGGPSRIEVYDAAMQADARDQAGVRDELEWAIDHGELVAVFQPVLDLVSHRMSGVEALARWRHPDRGLLAASEFLDVAESSGLILALGRWIALQAGTALNVLVGSSEPGAEGLRTPWMSLNLSARQLTDAHLVEDLIGAVEQTGVDPRMVMVEITEDAAASDPSAAMAVITRLRDAGIRVALDDFGRGPSSLSFLQRFPIDVLKIDRQMIADLDVDERARGVVAAVIRLAHALGIEVVAEGVETEAQADWLAEAGCDLVQGYHVSAPVDLDELIAGSWLE